MATNEKPTMGRQIREARTRAGLTLREVGAALGGLCAPYIHDLENDRRKLSPARWGELRKVLPTLNMRAFAEAAIDHGPIEVDPAMLNRKQRGVIVAILLKQAGAGDT